jgi:hypothetical protein
MNIEEKAAQTIVQEHIAPELLAGD